MLDHPRIFFLVSLFILWLSAQIGASLRKRWPLKDEAREDFGVVVAATLTLLGLIIGFSFSMATSRYDLREASKKPRPTQSARSMFALGFCPPRMRQLCARN